LAGEVELVARDASAIRVAGSESAQTTNLQKRREAEGVATCGLIVPLQDMSGTAPRVGFVTAAVFSVNRWGAVPKIFEQDGYSFFFYSNDHAPIRVHVRRGGGEAVFVVDPKVELRESVGFNGRELSRAEDLIDDHLELIKQKWAEHLG
jgi:hypothetical protein